MLEPIDATLVGSVHGAGRATHCIPQCVDGSGFSILLKQAVHSDGWNGALNFRLVSSGARFLLLMLPVSMRCDILSGLCVSCSHGDGACCLFFPSPLVVSLHLAGNLAFSLDDRLYPWFSCCPCSADQVFFGL